MIHVGDALTVLRTLPDASVQCCVTSPPYWGLRDYGVGGQIGLESTPIEYVTQLVGVFREVRRVLRDDGTLWLNLGDTYCNSDKWGGGGANTGKHTRAPDGSVESWKAVRRRWATIPGIKPKDLVGIPWMVALALRADGWYLRSDIIWHKPNPMPESVTDRPTKSHEYIFLLSKSEQYYYDHETVKEPAVYSGLRPSAKKGSFKGKTEAMAGTGQNAFRAITETRNLRDVWTVTSQPFKGAHFATFPPKLIEPCILAGSPDFGIVLDPFCGAGTTGLVAEENGREFIGIELNPEYAAMAVNRLAQAAL